MYQMQAALSEPMPPSAQDRELIATVQRERSRLLAFIRRRIDDAAEAEDVVQEALYELVLAQRMLQPVERAGAWLARVARNRLIDRFRRRRPQRSLDELGPAADPDTEEGSFDALLPPTDGGPEADLMRAALLQEIEAALAELPGEQREVFLAHEIEGVSFKELAKRSGVGVNTLLARKRYAVLHLQRRLRQSWDEWLTS
jgi:RNA polymerase sigma factor (sigma-70 family)